MINNNTKFSMKTRANGRRRLDSHDKSFKYTKFARKTISTWQQLEQPEGKEKFLALLRFFFRCSLRASNKFSYIIQTEQTSLSYAQQLFVFQTININRVWCLRFFARTKVHRTLCAHSSAKMIESDWCGLYRFPSQWNSRKNKSGIWTCNFLFDCFYSFHFSRWRSWKTLSISEHTLVACN